MVNTEKYLKEMPDGRIVVNCYAAQVLYPEEYTQSAYRAHAYYSILGTKIKVFGVGLQRYFMNEKEMEQPENITAHTLGIPTMITMEPSEIETATVRVSPHGPLRKWVILTFYKGDSFLVSKETIVNTDYAMMYLSRLKQGKLDYLIPDHVIGIQNDVQNLNNIDFRIPSEEEEIFVAEKYRDPDHPNRKYRYHTGEVDPDSMVAYNARTEMMKQSSFQALLGEDINSSVLINANRHREGIKEEVSPFEAVIRGMDMSKYAEEDYPDE